jgi:DNA topoisomerase VI subunit B
VDESKSKTTWFRRRTDWMPAPPAETKHHPSSVNIELLKNLRDTTKTATLAQFLCKEFTSIGKDYASRLCAELGQDLEPGTPIKEVGQSNEMKCNHLRFRIYLVPTLVHILRLPTPLL